MAHLGLEIILRLPQKRLQQFNVPDSESGLDMRHARLATCQSRGHHHEDPFPREYPPAQDLRRVRTIEAPRVSQASRMLGEKPFPVRLVGDLARQTGQAKVQPHNRQGAGEEDRGREEGEEGVARDESDKRRGRFAAPRSPGHTYHTH